LGWSLLEVDAITLVSAKVDATTQRLDLNVNVVNSSAHPLCEICGSFDHLTVNYHIVSPFAQDTSDEVNYTNYKSRLTNDAYSNTYNLG